MNQRKKLFLLVLLVSQFNFSNTTIIEWLKKNGVKTATYVSNHTCFNLYI